ncbi:hypothetical protein ACTWQF_36635 [Streptomyces sp. 8N114]|uniref:hypothetical protein n=1 Tax=Streptomyces sp. 8N114 TaxID=3457419 RepID=UPI003FD0784B
MTPRFDLVGRISDVCIRGSNVVHLRLWSLTGEGDDELEVELADPELAVKVIAEAWGPGDVVTVKVPADAKALLGLVG